MVERGDTLAMVGLCIDRARRVKGAQRSKALPHSFGRLRGCPVSELARDPRTPRARLTPIQQGGHGLLRASAPRDETRYDKYGARPSPISLQQALAMAAS
jgi:hypothetical protein